MPPLVERVTIVREAAQRLGYPHGSTLAQLLCQRYYWHGLVADCVRLCSAWLPVQLERRDFRPGRVLLPTYKGNLPFECWCIDLLKWGEQLLIVCVCAFSKWVEAAVL